MVRLLEIYVVLNSFLRKMRKAQLWTDEGKRKAEK